MTKVRFKGNSPPQPVVLVGLLAIALQANAAERFAPASDPLHAGGWVLNKSISDEFDGAKADAVAAFI